MKKIICIVLAALMATAFFACGGETAPDTSNESRESNNASVYFSEADGQQSTPEDSSQATESSSSPINGENSNGDPNTSSSAAQEEYTQKVTYRLIPIPPGSEAPPDMVPTHKNDAEYILGLILNGKWENDVHKCIADYTVCADGRNYEYSSECGCFTDKESGRTLDLGTGSRAHIRLNAIFGVISQKYKLVVRPSYNQHITVPLNERDVNTVLSYILSVTDWIDGTCDCMYDYIFDVYENGQFTKIGYSRSCGSLNDFTNQRSYELADDVRDEINRIIDSTNRDLSEQAELTEIVFESAPSGYNYVFTGDDADRIIDCLKSFKVTLAPESELDTLHFGMCWIITFKYDNGGGKTIYYSDKFINEIYGTVYLVDEADRLAFGTLIEELRNK